MSKHTPGPWKQGYIVDNNRLTHLPKEQLEVFETDEKLSVYANFSPMDNGRGRNLIARTYSVTDAARIVECVNACEGIEDPSRQIKNMTFEWLSAKTENERLQDQLRQIESLVSTFTSGLQGVISDKEYADFWSKFNAITGTGTGGGQS